MPIKRLSQSGLLTFEKYSSMLAGNAAYEPPSNTYELIETSILTSAQGTISFSNLNSTYGSTYQHLQLRVTARSNRAGTNEDHIYIRFNGDAGANYRHHYLTGTGSSLVAGDPTSTFPNGAFTFFGVTATNSTAGSFGGSIIDILDPFKTTKNTTVRFLQGSSGINRMALGSAVWLNTAAVSSLELVCVNSTFVIGSRFSLYGIRST